MPIKIAGESLNACSGCEISILDMGEKFLTLLKFADIVHLPLLMDSKGRGHDPLEFKLPEADVGLVSGGIKTRDHLETAKAMRDACDLIIAFGTCAVHGGIPAMANSCRNEELLFGRSGAGSTDREENFQSGLVPDLLSACYALDEHIHVDIRLPGCPPHPDHIFRALESIEKKQAFSMPEKSVCDHCPAARKGKGLAKKMKRVLDLPEWKTRENPDRPMDCFLDQGFVCLGPVTRNGCGGDGGLARCILAKVPCTGCYGPVTDDGNQRLAMLNALASNGIDLSALPETLSWLRFSGGHGRLRPLPRIKEGE